MSFKGSVPEEWKPLIMQTEQQCLWLRGLMPSRLTKQQDSYYLAWDGPEASAVERTGLFTTQLLDMSGLKFGTDGSGGSSTSDTRTRMCSWAVAVVGTEAPRQVLGTLGGPLPGRQQTVSMAEAFAIRHLLMFTTGRAEFVTDGLGCFRRFRKLRNMTEFQTQCLAGAHVWADIQRLAADRDVQISIGCLASLVLLPRRRLIGCWLLILLLTRRLAGKLANATVELCCSIGVKLPPFLIAGLCKFSKI